MDIKGGGVDESDDDTFQDPGKNRSDGNRSIVSMLKRSARLGHG